MNLNKLNETIKKVLNETNSEKTIVRVQEISKSIGEGDLLNQIVKHLEDHTLNEILDQVATEFDLRKNDLQVADMNNQPEKPQAHTAKNFTQPGIPTSNANLDEQKTPKKGEPGWHQLQIAKKTLGYSDAGAAIMGGMTKVEAQEIVNKYKKKELDEKHLTKPETKKKEEIVKAIKGDSQKVKDFKNRYGKDWKKVAFAIATKNAKRLAEIEVSGEPEVETEEPLHGFITTLVMNSMGHLHIWKGSKNPIQVAKYNWTVDGKESDLYIQNDTDIETMLDYLSPDERERLESGWSVVTNKIPSDYFGD